jgi:hypothetical protein
MEQNNYERLLRLFRDVKKGSRGFHVESVKPHLDIMTDYASRCKSVTEFGVGTACATMAFLLSGCKRVYGYDIVISHNARLVKQAADEDGVHLKLIEKDDLKVRIKKTDLLFIDTDHWYGQIKAELARHYKKVRKYILLHSTETFGLMNPFDGRPGMKSAIYEFMEEHPEWQIREHISSGHGMTVLERLP